MENLPSHSGLYKLFVCTCILSALYILPVCVCVGGGVVCGGGVGGGGVVWVFLCASVFTCVCLCMYM